MKASTPSQSEPRNIKAGQTSTVAVVGTEKSSATTTNRQRSSTGHKTVAERLHVLRAKWTEQLEIEGMKAGRKWAGHRSNGAALERLATSADLWWGLVCYDYSDLPNGELLVYTIQPKHDGDQDAAFDFWESVTGARELPHDIFICAFAETAKEIWEQTQD